MIITIKGASGSGKSTLINNIRKFYHPPLKYYIDGRRQPIGYTHTRPSRRPLAVVGHYESPCGGCDTIHNMDEIFERVRKSHDAGYDVIFEGLLISNDYNRTVALHKDGYPLIVIGLTEVSLKVCEESIMLRRKAKAEKTGKPVKPINMKNTTNKFKATISTCNRLHTAGVKVFRCGREQAMSICEEALEI